MKWLGGHTDTWRSGCRYQSLARRRSSSSRSPPPSGLSRSFDPEQGGSTGAPGAPLLFQSDQGLLQRVLWFLQLQLWRGGHPGCWAEGSSHLRGHQPEKQRITWSGPKSAQEEDTCRQSRSETHVAVEGCNEKLNFSTGCFVEIIILLLPI